MGGNDIDHTPAMSADRAGNDTDHTPAMSTDHVGDLPDSTWSVLLSRSKLDAFIMDVSSFVVTTFSLIQCLTSMLGLLYVFLCGSANGVNEISVPYGESTYLLEI